MATITYDIVDKVDKEVNVPINHNITDFIEFIVWSGVAEPEFHRWSLLRELWDDWLSK